MVRQSINRQLTWLRRLLPACDNDPSVAKRQLAWMKEKIIADRAHYDDNNNKASLTSLTKIEIDLMDTFISQRVEQHMPLQYILGTQPFYDLDIITRPPTLIPRWETEEWTCRLVELLRPHWERQHQQKPAQRMRRKILDVCTGSGCIALGLAAHLPKNSTDIVGIDIADTAIQLANDNHKAHADLLNGNKVHFQLMDIYDSEVEQQLFGNKNNDDDDTSLDLVVSNPPYVTQDEYASLEPEVKQWEDKGALVADDLGTHLHRRLIELVAHSNSKRNNDTHDDLPRIVMEIGGAHQVPPLQQALADHGFNNIKVWKDLAGKDRVVLAS